MRGKETTLKEVGEMLAHIVEHMATKDDIAQLRTEMATKDDVRAIVSEELRPIRAELADIRRELDELSESVGNVRGYRKEIDYALERIAAIEKHLGIERKIAA